MPDKTIDGNATVGEIRKLIAPLPDDAEFDLVWNKGDEPGDSDPAIAIRAWRRRGKKLEIIVALEYLNEELTDDDE